MSHSLVLGYGYSLTPRPLLEDSWSWERCWTTCWHHTLDNRIREDEVVTEGGEGDYATPYRVGIVDWWIVSASERASESGSWARFLRLNQNNIVWEGALG
jgi:hypothetical protein